MTPSWIVPAGNESVTLREAIAYPVASVQPDAAPAVADQDVHALKCDAAAEAGAASAASAVKTNALPLRAMLVTTGPGSMKLLPLLLLMLKAAMSPPGEVSGFVAGFA